MLCPSCPTRTTCFGNVDSCAGCSEMTVRFVTVTPAAAKPLHKCTFCLKLFRSGARKVRCPSCQETKSTGNNNKSCFGNVESCPGCSEMTVRFVRKSTRKITRKSKTPHTCRKCNKSFSSSAETPRCPPSNCDVFSYCRGGVDCPGCDENTDYVESSQVRRDAGLRTWAVTASSSSKPLHTCRNCNKSFQSEAKPPRCPPTNCNVQSICRGHPNCQGCDENTYCTISYNKKK